MLFPFQRWVDTHSTTLPTSQHQIMVADVHIGSMICSRGVCFLFIGWFCYGCSSGGRRNDKTQRRLTQKRLTSSKSRTNRRNKGWTSADRSTKATLMLTVPRSLFKSSTKDLTWPTLENIIAVWCWHKCYCYTQTSVKVSIVACQHGFWLRGVQS